VEELVCGPRLAREVVFPLIRPGRSVRRAFRQKLDALSRRITVVLEVLRRIGRQLECITARNINREGGRIVATVIEYT
jgi:hypothetical protein